MRGVGSVVTVRSRYDVRRAELAELLADEPRYRVEQVWQGLYRDVADPEEMSTLPRAMRARLATALPPALSPAVTRETDDGDTVKTLWTLHDGAVIESVTMAYPDRVTVCVSTQAGCAMACGFCATGQAGFQRHLSVGEIVEQVARASRLARTTGRRLSNVVFMGMGEPLANYDGTWSAVECLHDEFGLSARHLTVSTVGIVPGIRRLAAETLPVNLAVSLHAATDELRDELVPLNRRYPLDALHAACTEYLRATRRRISIEWALIRGVNDTDTQAAALAGWARSLPLPAHVNLIPLNPTPGYPVQGTSRAGVAAFRDRLERAGVNATVRRTRGVEIDGACGQLAAGQPVRLRTRPSPASG